MGAFLTLICHGPWEKLHLPSYFFIDRTMTGHVSICFIFSPDFDRRMRCTLCHKPMQRILLQQTSKQCRRKWWLLRETQSESANQHPGEGWILHQVGLDLSKGSGTLYKGNAYTLPTDQTIYNRILSKVYCDVFTYRLRNTWKNQCNILLWITVRTILITESHANS